MNKNQLAFDACFLLIMNYLKSFGYFPFWLSNTNMLVHNHSAIHLHGLQTKTSLCQINWILPFLFSIKMLLFCTWYFSHIPSARFHVWNCKDAKFTCASTVKISNHLRISKVVMKKNSIVLKFFDHYLIKFVDNVKKKQSWLNQILCFNRTTPKVIRMSKMSLTLMRNTKTL